MNKFFSSLAFLCLIIFQTSAQDPCVKKTLANPYVTSWLANDGGKQSSHVPHWMEYLTASPDGAVATVTGWDEGGSNVVVYRNGEIINVPEGSGTGGWGRMSMLGVALDSLYIYHLQSQHGCDGGNNSMNQNGLPQFPPCVDGQDNTWRTVRRYPLAPAAARTFPNGYGYAANMMIVDTGAVSLTGIALYGSEIFVSDPKDNSVRVYSKLSMDSKALRKYVFPGGVGQLSADNAGGIWMLQATQRKIICFSALTGELLPQEILFTDPAVLPSTFFVDARRNRILVADNGINQQILFYGPMDGTPELTGTFGEQFGILSGVAGAYAPRKLFDIHGVAADSSGNIYVANSIPSGGAILQAYDPAGELLWENKGLVFTATACADPDSLEQVYTFDKKFRMDYSKTTPGTEWSFEAYTLNRFKYPDDPRLHGGFFTSAWIKNIQGRKYLFATDMYASMLAGYRFQAETDGEVAIPMLLMNIGGWNTQDNYPVKLGSDKDFIWMDLNGDGQVQPDEFTYKTGFDNPFSMAVWVDSTGNIWKGIRESGVRLIPLQEMNAQGVLIYDFSKTKLLDIGKSGTGTNGVKRLVYDQRKDELFVAGFSNEKPDETSTGQGKDTWWCMGSTLCKYTHVLDTIEKNPSVDFKNIPPAWKVFIPFFPEGDPAGITDDDAKSFTVEGDYLFIALARNGKINIYETSDGSYVSQMTPGPEVNRESGWTDIDYSINVSRRPEEYLIFNEENAFAKVLMYRIKNFETNDFLYPDATLSRFELLDRDEKPVTSLAPGQYLHFRATVKNIGPGPIPNGSKTTDHKSFTLSFLIKDLVTNISKQFKSDTFTLGLASMDTVQLYNNSWVVPSEWTTGKSKYRITVRVMLSSPSQECNSTNNTLVVEMASYDKPFVFKDPASQQVLVHKTAQFSVEAYGLAPLTYTWLVNGIPQTSPGGPEFSMKDVSLALNNAKIKVVVSNELGSDTSAEAILKVSDPYGASRPGSLLREVWFNIGGTAVSDLLSDPRYPNAPDQIDFITKYEVPTNVLDNYGTRVCGWLIPPQTGKYVFYFASDDHGELHLSSDSLPEHLLADPVAWVPEWTDPRVYTTFPDQTSDSIFLEQGKVYYTEAFFKEEAGGDNMAVCWRLPNGTLENPIPSSRIAYYSANPSVGIRVNEKEGELHVFPSPARNYINIIPEGLQGRTGITIMDLSGRIVHSEVRSSQDGELIRIDISHLARGLYILNVAGENATITRKFLVQD